MFYDIKYVYRKRGEEETHEKTSRIENSKGPTGPKDLVVAAYQAFAKRDIEIVSFNAVMYVPRILDVGIDDEGRVTLDGRPYGLGEDISEKELTSFPSAGIVAEIPSAQTHQVPSQALPPRPKETDRLPMQLDRKTTQGLDGDETRWHPNSDERNSGFTCVSIYGNQRRIKFDPPGPDAIYTSIPIQRGTVLSIKEKFWKANVDFYKVDIPDGPSAFIPAMHFVDAPAAMDPMLTIQADKEDTAGNTRIVGQTKDGNQVLESVPLQGVGRKDGPAGGMPYFDKNGIVHGMEELDIRASRKR